MGLILEMGGVILRLCMRSRQNLILSRKRKKLDRFILLPLGLRIIKPQPHFKNIENFYLQLVINQIGWCSVNEDDRVVGLCGYFC